jgi:vacuolar-type H+-ATPase subunit H
LELIKNIKKAEADARDIVEKAKAHAIELVQQAKAKAAESLTTEQENRRKSIADAVSAAENTGHQEVDSLTTAAGEHIQQIENNARSKMPSAVAKVMEGLKRS